MRGRSVIVLFLSPVLAVALLIIAGSQLDYINSQRQQMHLISNKPLENAPPALAFATVAMGAFRGLVVDILWMRADRLKEQGQFFDAKQLADWITTLQPRFASVWEFQAWNMAYNISVAIPASQPAERWRWVKNGYELLRDKGIPLNPKTIKLYRELAWIFQHKIGAVSDDAHKYYKLQLALAMQPLLGPADDEYFKALAQAPTTWQQIATDANVAPLINALKSSDQAFANDKSFVSNYLSLRQNPGKFAPAAFKVIDRFRGTKALEKFDIFAKAYHLRNTWKLDPVLMQKLNKTLGPVDWKHPDKHLPLDWRHPDTHAIYWAAKGFQVAGRGSLSVGEINSDRIINHSLQNLFRNGKMFIYKAPQKTSSNFSSQAEQSPQMEVFLRPDLRMFESCNKSDLARMEKYKNLKNHGTYESMQIGHRNMLKNAVLLFYQAGHKNRAQEIYDELRKLYPSDEFKVPLVAYVRKRLVDELHAIGIFDAKEMAIALLRDSYFRYALHDDDEAAARESLAKEVYDFYQSSYSDEHRINLPEFKMLRYFGLVDFLNDAQFPIDLRLSLINRIKIEKPDLARQFEQIEKKLLDQSGQSTPK